MISERLIKKWLQTIKYVKLAVTPAIATGQSVKIVPVTYAPVVEL